MYNFLNLVYISSFLSRPSVLPSSSPTPRLRAAEAAEVPERMVPWVAHFSISIYIYIHIYIFMYICIYIYIFKYVYMYTCVYIYLVLYIYLFVYVWLIADIDDVNINIVY